MENLVHDVAENAHRPSPALTAELPSNEARRRKCRWIEERTRVRPVERARGETS
jgi:hypothetical protein